MPEMYDGGVQDDFEMGNESGDNLDINGTTRVARGASGTNKPSGLITLNGTTGVTVNNSLVTANSIILLGGNAPAGTPAPAYVSATVAGTSFTVKSSASDTSVIGYWIIEPADSDTSINS